MSIETTYTKFGSSFGGGLIDTVGTQGPPGVGFKLTVGGDYDIENKSFENVNNLDVQGQIENLSLGDINVGNSFDMQNNDLKGVNNISIGNDIVYSGAKTNNLLTTVLSIDTGDGNKIKETDLSSLALEDIQVNNISQKDNGFIQINDDISLVNGNQLKITDLSPIKTNDCFIHGQSNDSVCLFLESDVNDDLETDVSYMVLTADGNNTQFELRNASGASNKILFYTGSGTAGGTQVGYTFYKADVTNNGTGIVGSFSNSNLLLDLDDTGIHAGVNLNLNTNNIIDIDNIEANTAVFNTIANDDTATKLLVLDGSNNVDYRTVASLPGDSFDQSLNTTDDVLFKELNTSSTGSSGLFIEANNNNVLGANQEPYISLRGSKLTTDKHGFEISYLESSGSSDKRIKFVSGSTSPALLTGYQFYITDNMVDNTPTRPTLPRDTILLEMTNGGISMHRFLNMVNSYIDLNNNDIIDIKDIDTSGVVTMSNTANTTDKTDFLVLDGDIVKKQTHVFGTEFNNVSSITVSSTTSALFVQKANITTFLPAGDYLISWYCEITNSNKNNATEVRIQLDNATNLSNIKSPQLLVAEDYIPFSGSIVQTLTLGVHDFDLDYRALATTARIRNAYIQFHRIE